MAFARLLLHAEGNEKVLSFSGMRVFVVQYPLTFLFGQGLSLSRARGNPVVLESNIAAEAFLV